MSEPVRITEQDREEVFLVLRAYDLTDRITSEQYDDLSESLAEMRAAARQAAEQRAERLLRAVVLIDSLITNAMTQPGYEIWQTLGRIQDACRAERESAARGEQDK